MCDNYLLWLRFCMNRKSDFTNFSVYSPDLNNWGVRNTEAEDADPLDNRMRTNLDE